MMRLTAAVIVSVLFAVANDATHAQNGTFTFRENRSRVLPLTVADLDGVPGIVWPELVDAKWHTALLGVQISAEAAATAPYVEIAAGQASDRQYFPPGDVGERWLNLAFLRGAVVGTRISLRGEGVAFTTPAATLRLFEGTLDLNKPVLVLAPHPDDAEIAAFGLYANRNATVVTESSPGATPLKPVKSRMDSEPAPPLLLGTPPALGTPSASLATTACCPFGAMAIESG